MTANNINIFHYGQTTCISKSAFILSTMITPLDSHQQETECDGGKVRVEKTVISTDYSENVLLYTIYKNIEPQKHNASTSLGFESE